MGKRLPRLDGTVITVSADRLTDKVRGTPYFQLRVEASDHTDELLSSHQLRPGMAVDVMIFTGERTVVQYLTAPLLSFFSGALRE